MHSDKSPLAGSTVKLSDTIEHPQFDLKGQEFWVEDWADRVFGRSIWMADGNPAALIYALRTAEHNLPMDDEILYGKVGPLGHLIHVSELSLDSDD